VLSLGLAAGRTEISVEKVAVNYTSKSKDNAGVLPSDQAVVPGGPDAFFATIPAEQMVEDITAKGIRQSSRLRQGLTSATMPSTARPVTQRKREERPW
jgi:pyroglutamyl-peptidase